MRVVYLSPSAQLGGAERCLLDLMGALASTGPVTSMALVTPSDGPLAAASERLGVDVRVLPFPAGVESLGDSAVRLAGVRAASRARLAGRALAAGWSANAYRRRLGRLLGELGPDVVHSNGIKFHALAGLVRLGGAPLIWHVRDFVSTRPIAARVLRRLGSRVRRVVAISDAVARDVRSVLPGIPVTRIYDAIDVDEFQPGPDEGEALDALAGAAPAGAKVVRVGLVATFARWKGQDGFIRAAGRLARTGRAHGLRFVIVGGPVYATAGSQFSVEELAALARDAGAGEIVSFVPFQADPAWVFRALDVVVHCSTEPEPFGRTIAEAMACGRPVVLSDASGAAELLSDDGSAMRVPMGDEEALADAIARLAASAPLRERMGRRAAEVARARFALERLRREVVELYAELLDSRPDGTRGGYD